MDLLQRRRELNHMAYQQVLRALFASSTSDAKTMTTLMKLRRELDITNDEHRGWYEELKRHQQAGTLHAMLRQPLTAQGAATAAVPMQQPAYGSASMQQPVVQQRMYTQPTVSTVTANAYGQPQPVRPVAQQPQSHLQPVRQPAAVTAAPQQRLAAVATAAGQVRTSGGAQGSGTAARPGGASAPKSQSKSQPKKKKKKKADSSDEDEAADSMEDTVSDELGDDSGDESGGAGTSYDRAYGNGAGTSGRAAAGSRPRGSLGDAAKKKKKPKIDLSTLPELIGVKVQRYWPKEQQWFLGVVTDYRERDGLYCITYQLGKKDESMEWFNIDHAEAQGNPQMSHYQRTPERIDLRRHAGTRAYQNSSVFHPSKSKKKAPGGGNPRGRQRGLSPACSTSPSHGSCHTRTPCGRRGRVWGKWDGRQQLCRQLAAQAADLGVMTQLCVAWRTHWA